MNLDEAKRYKDPLRKAIIIIFGILVAFSLAVLAFAFWVSNAPWQQTIPGFLISTLIILALLAILLIILLPYAFSTIEVSRYAVTWRCLFHKAVSLSGADCVSVSVLPITSYRYGRPVFTSYFIYLSKEPLSKKAKEKLTAKTPKNGLIWFRYSDEICLHLIKVLPVSKTRSLEGFYNQRQDEKRELEKIKARRKRLKEKEKQRKKEQKHKK